MRETKELVVSSATVKGKQLGFYMILLEWQWGRVIAAPASARLSHVPNSGHPDIHMGQIGRKIRWVRFQGDGPPSQLFEIQSLGLGVLDPSPVYLVENPQMVHWGKKDFDSERTKKM